MIAGVAIAERLEGKADLLGLAWHVDFNLQIGGFVHRRVEVAILSEAILTLGA
jgi:hypothetical protein